jgi:hypothetical protein
MKRTSAPNSIDLIARSIVVFRGNKVLLDSDLAALYGVTTARLNQQVRRNIKRFPADFMFQLSKEEHSALMLQFATSKRMRGGRRKTPLVFTEHGSIQAANVLRSKRAVEMSIFVVRAFVRLREVLASNRALARRLDELERKLNTHDRTIADIIKAIRELMNPPAPKSRPIGFTANLDNRE